MIEDSNTRQSITTNPKKYSKFLPCIRSYWDFAFVTGNGKKRVVVTVVVVVAHRRSTTGFSMLS